MYTLDKFAMFATASYTETQTHFASYGTARSALWQVTSDRDIEHERSMIVAAEAALHRVYDNIRGAVDYVANKSARRGPRESG